MPWLLLLSLVVAAATAPAQDVWRAATAQVRFEVEITDAPSDPCAGILVLLPDGGLLPRPTADAIVFDEAGKELRSGSVWHNLREGYGVIFEPPAKGKRAFVYLRPGQRRAVPGDFCPSLLLQTQPGKASLDEARLLAKENRGGRIGLVDRIGDVFNPFGPDDNYTSYYSGYLKITKSGRYYLATVSDEGSEVHINGKTVASWPGIHTRQAGAKGQYGDNVALTDGRHRIEYFHFEVTGAQETHLLWRQPDDKPDALPTTVPASAFIRSGSARVVDVVNRAGTPLAWFTFAAESYLWLGAQPVNLYRFRARQEGVWDFGGGQQVKGKEAVWLIEGNEPRDVAFRLASSSYSRPVYFDRPPQGASINNNGQRREYRSVLLGMCRAVVPPRRPCADWSTNLWATLLGVVEPHEGQDVLDEVFERSRQDVIALKKEDRRWLEDVYFDLLRESDVNRAFQWQERFLREETDNARRFDWQLARVDVLLYEVNDLAKARAAAAGLINVAPAAGPEAVARLLVRQGDIERLAGEKEAARKLYATAQERYQKSRPDWRAEAVRQASLYEMVRSLIEQYALPDARELMRKWELELPLSKLDGDYVLAEAAYWRAVGQCAKAVRSLRAYREQVDLTTFLPQAMEQEADCLVTLKKYDELAALVADMQKRFPTLDLTKKTAQLLEDLRRAPATPLRRTLE